MRNTLRIIVEADKGTTLSMVASEAEKLKVVLKEAGLSVPVIIAHNGRLYETIWQEFKEKT